MNFTSIDFETATGKRYSACSIAIVTIREGKIVDEFQTLIQPPDNVYSPGNISIHGITPEDTKGSPLFPEVYPEIKARLYQTFPIAHNESFDRNVLRQTMEYYGLNYEELQLPKRWGCTMKIYRRAGFRPYKLDACCRQMGVSLNHHEALADARACAYLYMKMPSASQ